MLTTSTAEKTVLTPEREDIQIKLQKHSSIAVPQKQTIKSSLKKIDKYSSVLGLMLVVCFLLMALRDQDVIKIEGSKALLVAGILNLIRVFSTSKI